MDPKIFGITQHEKLREKQAPMLIWGNAVESIGILEASTGSGKTVLPTSLASRMRTVALVQKKFLQLDNYRDRYGFAVMMGRKNYSCIHNSADGGQMADRCFHMTNMRKCTFWANCPYVKARNIAQAVKAACLNYSLWLHWYEKWPEINALVLDEAHQLPDITLTHAGLKVTHQNIKEWDLPELPVISKTSKDPVGRSMDYMTECAGVMAQHVAILRPAAERKAKAAKRLQIAEILERDIKSSIQAMEKETRDWFIRSYPDFMVENEYKAMFFAKPLTARYHAPTYFMFNNPKVRVLAMSATIGKFDTFAKELGIMSFDRHVVGNLWAADKRPIYDLGCPGMGSKASYQDYEDQADRIAASLKQFPEDWSGLILTKSEFQAKSLANRLAKRGLSHRMFLMPKGMGTEQQMNLWQRAKKQAPGRLCVNWSFWEGYDGTEEKIVITAKVPYPYLGDEYERARQRFNGSMFYQRTAWQLEQGFGRTRRGRDEDYDTRDEIRGFVAIADGNWKMVQKYLSESTREAIVKFFNS